MKKLTNWVFSPPSIRLNTMVVLEIFLLLLLSLGTLFYYARTSLVNESKMDAEQRLEGTVQQVDNILLEIEQSTGNFYHDLVHHLDQPERMMSYCRKLMECTPDIDGCMIAFKPGYYPDSLFMAYVRRDEIKSLVSSPNFGHKPYTEQIWFTNTMKSKKPQWIPILKEDEVDDKPVISFCLPIFDDSKECVGTMAVDLSLEFLSQYVLSTKPTPNSYSVLIDSKGSFIIHPEKKKILGHSALTLADKLESPSMKATVKEMMEGGTGNHSFRLFGETWYVFFKPFVRTNVSGRSMKALNWSIATIYPKGDIFNEYNHHITHLIIISLVGLLIFYAITRFIIRKQLRPLRRLTESAYSIAEGNYSTTIPETERKDEIGMFQQNFKLMQEALLTEISQQEQLNAKLNEHREELRKVHQQIQEDEDVKRTLLHNVTDRMMPPTMSISASVNALCDNQNISPQEVDKEVDNIRNQSAIIMDLLNRKFKASYNTEKGKEDSHE